MKKRPKLRIPFTALDKFLEMLSLIGLISIIAYSIYIYNKLPNKIPGHFDFEGNVTNYTGKGGLIALPIASLFMYIPLTLLEKVPHVYNYIVTITEENAYTQYSIGRRMIISLKTIVVFMFLSIQLSIAKVAMSKVNEASIVFTMMLLVLMFSVLGYYIYLSIKNK